MSQLRLPAFKRCLSAPYAWPRSETERPNAMFSVADQGMKARLADLGNAPMPMTSAEFGKLIVEETEKWAKVIKFAGLKAE
jgi:hypothetical protein